MHPLTMGLRFLTVLTIISVFVLAGISNKDVSDWCGAPSGISDQVCGQR